MDLYHIITFFGQHGQVKKRVLSNKYIGRMLYRYLINMTIKKYNIENYIYLINPIIIKTQ